mmetsp:Transcript_14215/g.21334  ORF Transcript_14215/g.21334 Transcript_14215/m.21334 type:complete len:83 (+) Transcript_14215:1024-1272(+)
MFRLEIRLDRKMEILRQPLREDYYWLLLNVNKSKRMCRIVLISRNVMMQSVMSSIMSYPFPFETDQHVFGASAFLVIIIEIK